MDDKTTVRSPVRMGMSKQMKQYICFKLASEEYAIDIDHIQEVLRLRNITAVPQMPLFVLGVINIRGNVIPLFDLRIRFGLGQKEFDHQSKIVVVKIDNQLLAIVVDQILNNINLSVEDIDPTPLRKMSINQECIDGIGELENRIVVLLNIHKLHDDLLAGIHNAIGNIND